MFESWHSSIIDFAQQNEQALNDTLAANSGEIIISLGGLSNIIHLCLSNPDASKYIDKEQFKSFEAIMTKNGISSDKEVINETSISMSLSEPETMDNDDITTKPLKIEKQSNSSDSLSICNDGYDNDEICFPKNDYSKHIRGPIFNHNRSNTKHNQNQLITNITNLDEYHKSRLIINIKEEDKMVFQLLGMNCCTKKLITNKIFLYSLLALIIFGYILAFTFLIMYGSNELYFATLGGTFWIAILDAITLFLNADMPLLYEIFRTFDFGFILGNSIIVLIAKCVLDMHNGDLVWYEVYSITRSVTLVFVASVLASFDAIHVSKPFKVIVRTIVVIYFTFVCSN